MTACALECLSFPFLSFSFLPFSLSSVGPGFTEALTDSALLPFRVPKDRGSGGRHIIPSLFANPKHKWPSAGPGFI
ncbi:hypothetical protein LZ32DRAFT_609151 [Colletotrichum eremochloae]|nr:hypothetical protein LZ32DRAFT_609151 [Colletotrichum eremochloae]